MYVTTEHLGTSGYREQERQFIRGLKDDIKEEIKIRLPFRDRYKRYYPEKYRPNGNSFCLWHEDAGHPDLQINDEKHFAKCHCCGVVVDIFDLEGKYRGLDVKNKADFKTILTTLADEAGVELPNKQRRVERNVYGGSSRDDIVYNYCDQNDILHYQRFREKGEKSFKFRRPDEKGKWIYTLYELDPKTGQKTNKKAVKRLLYRLAKVLRAHLEEFIIVVEGEKDVHTAESLGFVATTAGSANDWAALFKDSGHLPLKGRKIWLIPDNDEAGRKLVEAIRNTLALDADVRLLELPGLQEKGDLTDFFQYHGLDKAKEIILSTGRIAAKLMPRLPLGKDFRPDEWGDFIATHYQIRFFNGAFHEYHQGVYRERHQLQVENYVRSLGDGQLRQHHFSEVIHAVRRIGFSGDQEIDPLHIRNLANGLLDMTDPEDPALISHTPTIFSTMQLPIRFDKEARCPKFDIFLLAKMPELGLRLRFWEVLGYLLGPDTSMQVAFLIHGRTATGKSTLARTIIAFLGSKLVSHVPLRDMGQRFQLSAMVGKLLNISHDESESSRISDEIFKMLSGEDRVTVERKHEHHFSWRPTVRLMVISNFLPITRDTSEAFWRRWITLPMDVTTPENERVPNFEKDIIANEMSGILNKALIGLVRLKQQGHFTKSEKAEKLKGQWQMEANPILNWADQRLVPKEGSRVPLNRFVEDYNAWVKLQGHPEAPLDTTDFRKQLEMTLGVTVLKPQNKLTVADRDLR